MRLKRKRGREGGRRRGRGVHIMYTGERKKMRVREECQHCLCVRSVCVCTCAVDLRHTSRREREGVGSSK